MKTLYIFDFDDTLIYSPTQHEGKLIWERETGTNWPYNGWWGKAESLDSDIFYMEKNEWVYKKYLEAKSDDNSYTVLATGRLEKVNGMRSNIEKILNQHNLSFDEVHLNWGGDTYVFKTTLFEKLMKETGCDELVMYDDRHEHLVKFRHWAREQIFPTTIVDVVNKTTNKYNYNI